MSDAAQQHLQKHTKCKRKCKLCKRCAVVTDVCDTSSHNAVEEKRQPYMLALRIFWRVGAEGKTGCVPGQLIALRAAGCVSLGSSSCLRMGGTQAHWHVAKQGRRLLWRSLVINLSCLVNKSVSHRHVTWHTTSTAEHQLIVAN